MSFVVLLSVSVSSQLADAVGLTYHLGTLRWLAAFLSRPRISVFFIDTGGGVWSEEEEEGLSVSLCHWLHFKEDLGRQNQGGHSSMHELHTKRT